MAGSLVAADLPATAAPAPAAPLAAAPVATALSGSDFKAGNIIADAVFYESGTMTATQVQAFLDKQGSACVAGEQACLKDYTVTTPSTAAETNLCKAYAGATNEPASRIISKVSNACGINPRVLLVLLQKESSLVTKTKPTTVNYHSATGYGCPDGAPCDAQYYGLFNQLYRAARQYHVYRNNPTRYGYQAGRDNTILYNPNTTCGSSTVYIENQATAGLYIYTPYQPNAAALKNLYGTGDVCSAYGNRNFWRLFTDWFGSTQLNVSGGPDRLEYRAHVQNIGWQDWVPEGTMAGTTGRSLRVEALQLRLPAGSPSGGVQCSAHVQNIGWTGYVDTGQTCGTTGRSLRVEALRLRLTGSVASQFDIWYRVYVQNVGWLGWAKNGADAGTEGMGLRTESVEVRLVAKGQAGPTPQTMPSASIGLTVTPHVATLGWLAPVGQGQTAGTTGRSLALEALRVRTSSLPWAGGIQCRAHVQNIGWTGWVAPGATCGTTGRGLRMEAFSLQFSGSAAASLDVWYRAHVQNIGWMGWASNGAQSGTQGLGLRVESVQVVVQPRGSTPPGSTGNAFRTS
ncbi:hypothetical protein [Xylanimonas sp. McL0601]|uniref:hypothetical protein n=1 Tax=Xylanimonas sp. McL0601 TaxID=3414739 RepID=UPI003CEEA3F3